MDSKYTRKFLPELYIENFSINYIFKISENNMVLPSDFFVMKIRHFAINFFLPCNMA
jgi:hypothetical protein